MKNLMHFTTEGKIVFLVGHYMLLQAKLIEVAPGNDNFIQGY